MYLLYTKTNCPYCDQAKAALSSCGLPYEALMLDVDFAIGDIKNTVSEHLGRPVERLTFPAVFVDGKYIGGCAELFDHLLNENLAGAFS